MPKGTPQTITRDDANRDKAIAVLDNNLIRVQSDVTTILSNHLPHLQEDIKNLDKKIDASYEEIKKDMETKHADLKGDVAKISEAQNILIAKIGAYVTVGGVLLKYAVDYFLKLKDVGIK